MQYYAYHTHANLSIAHVRNHIHALKQESVARLILLRSFVRVYPYYFRSAFEPFLVLKTSYVYQGTEER